MRFGILGLLLPLVASPVELALVEPEPALGSLIEVDPALYRDPSDGRPLVFDTRIVPAEFGAELLSPAGPESPAAELGLILDIHFAAEALPLPSTSEIGERAIDLLAPRTVPEQSEPPGPASRR